MSCHVKFVQVNRTIDHNTKMHYLDAIDDEGRLWQATLDADRRRTGEKHPCFTRNGRWRRSFTHPEKEG